MVPEQEPSQWSNTYPTAGVAVSVTSRPRHSDVVHARVQTLPSTDDVTEPLPSTRTSKERLAGSAGPKFAVTDFAASIVTEQSSSVPVQAPDQPRNTAPGFGIATSWTVVPFG